MIELDPAFLPDVAAPIVTITSTRSAAVANYAFWEAFGYDPELETAVALDELGPASTRGAVRRAVEPLLSGDRTRMSMVKEFVRRDGSVFTGRVQASARLDDDETAHVTVSFTEVPSGVNADDADDADDVRAAPTTTNTAFVASVGHELRSPLHSILGLSELLADGEQLSPNDRDLAREILNQTAGLSRLVDDLLDYSTIYGTRVSLDIASESPHDLVDGIVRLFSPRAEAADSTLQSEIEPSVPTSMLTDGLRVRQILTNLVTNAIRHGGGGPITIAVSSPGSNQIRFTVVDQGPGIPPAVRDRIFEPFVQGQPKSPGSGLGLAITKGLVGLLGGSIGVSSDPESGTTFTVLLPLTSAESSGARPRPRLTTPGRRRTARPLEPGQHRVLVVEDEPVNQLLATSQLTKLGYLSDLVDNGSEALEMVEAANAEQRPYSAVLMDWHLPGIDGVETTRLLRHVEQVDTHRIPVPIIGVTANALPNDRQTCLDAGMDDFLAKPVGIGRLDAALGTWVCPIPLAPDGPLLDLTSLRSLGEELGDETAMFGLLQTFVNELPARLEPLEDVIEGREVDERELHRAVHSLKSTSALIGSTPVSSACAELESRLADARELRDRPSAHNRHRVVVLLANQLAAEVRSVLQSHGAEPVGGQSASTNMR